MDKNFTASSGKKTALVIGGVRGIGRAVTLRLARDGFDVYASCRAESEESRETEQLVAGCGKQLGLLLFDVRDRKGAEREITRVFGDGAPDVAVYNAGVARDNLMAFMSPEEWDEVIDVNLTGFYNTIHPIVFGMLGRRTGRIVAIASASGQTGQAGQVNYAASKAGLIGAVKALAREVGKKGILVNIVAPGFIETDMTKRIPFDKAAPLIPLNRAGRVSEVAGAVSFLCGEDSSYIHGQVLGVNGGLVI